VGPRALIWAAGVVAYICACGGQTSEHATDAGSEAAGDSTVPQDANVDALGDAPIDAGPAPLPGSNFAMHVLFLGDTTRTGDASATAWETYGRNIDGKVTTAQSTDVCTLVGGAPTTNQVDGVGGIDNSWGENVLPIILTIFGSDVSQQLNMAINSGIYTMMVDVVGLTTDSAQTSADASGQYFLGAVFPGMPTWSVADNWPVSTLLLVDGQTVASGSKVKFASGGIDAGAWSSGTPVDIPLFLPTSNGSLIQLVVHDAVITFLHSSPSQATSGTISGVFDTNEFLSAMQIFFGTVTGSFCSGSAWTAIATQLSQASDILSDGTNVAGQTCNGISVGIGFNADEIGPVQETADAAALATNPCDAGTD
jgi:hypothetical protein